MTPHTDAGALLKLAEDAFEFIRLKLIHDLKGPQAGAFWKAVNMRDAIRQAASQGSSGGGLRQALEEARGEVVLAIAFVGRDRGTDRINATLESLLNRFVKVDEKIRAALSPPVKTGGEVEMTPEQKALQYHYGSPDRYISARPVGAGAPPDWKQDQAETSRLCRSADKKENGLAHRLDPFPARGTDPALFDIAVTIDPAIQLTTTPDEHRERALRKAAQIVTDRGRADQSVPMRADIEQIISEGWRNGKTSAEVAAEILREFDVPAQEASNPCKHPNAKFWMHRDDDTWLLCPDCGSKWVEAPSVSSAGREEG